MLGPVHGGPRNFGARKGTRTLGFAYVEHERYVIGRERGVGEFGLRTVEQFQGKELKRRGGRASWHRVLTERWASRYSMAHPLVWCWHCLLWLIFARCLGSEMRNFKVSFQRGAADLLGSSRTRDECKKGLNMQKLRRGTAKHYSNLEGLSLIS